MGIIRSVPFQMKTGHDLPGESLMLSFSGMKTSECSKRHILTGPADLAVEIVSEDSRLRDRGEKFAEYEMGGVKEYWILDLDLRRADFFALSEGRYERRVEDVQGIYSSEAILGFWMKVEWLWNLPPVLDVLRDLGLI
jgi:hypothetical protein